ncbi:hypothetical protein B0T19DRAFT_407648 [Cercophora scortea]|uniref:Uncharacterized protein n=1 Tax=Cercophora scortea TaxID=314031 RepID=A0AAE0MKI3_9PEZI|nr:hypothetical protein B0T19DRAFT_407648 [Cercophora scortea]
MSSSSSPGVWVWAYGTRKSLSNRLVTYLALCSFQLRRCLASQSLVSCYLRCPLALLGVCGINFDCFLWSRLRGCGPLENDAEYEKGKGMTGCFNGWKGMACRAGRLSHFFVCFTQIRRSIFHSLDIHTGGVCRFCY